MPRSPVAAVARRDKPQVAIVGDSRTARGVKRSLEGLNVSLKRHDDLEAALETLAPSVRAVVLTTPLPETELLAAVTRVRERAPTLPVCAVVPDGFSNRRATRLYEAGVTAVFEWPYESLTLPAMVASLLGSPPRKAEAGDRALARAVRTRLKLAAEMAENVTAGVRGGTAVVRGAVPSLWMRDRLIRMLEHVPGVRAVVAHELEVDAPPRPDAELARNVRSVLGSVSAVDPHTLSVAVADGKVTLAGVVDRHHEMQRLLEIVANVRGVREIDNLVTVSNDAATAARRLASRIATGLEALVSSPDIEVTVFGKVVVLRGRVSSLSEKRSAHDLAMSMRGVERVVDKLVVSS